MLSYLVRRLLIGAVTLTAITFIVYGMIRNMPGNPLTQEMSRLDPRQTISAADLERLKRQYGLDKPWYQAYFIWAGNVVRGELGWSIPRKEHVAVMIRQRIGPTLLLSATSLVLTYLLSIPLGLYATHRYGRLDERIGSTLLYMLYSFPSFVAALFLQIVLSVQLEWLPLRGMYGPEFESLSTWGKACDILKHMLLPVTCFTYGSLAYYSRFIRANMHEVMLQDYIRTARAKGLGPLRVLCQHAFRNTLIPLVTLVGLTLPALLSGSVILERIFTWPGMGRLYFEALTERDYPTIMGLTLMFAVLTLAGQLFADVMYAVVDPRVRLENK